jgi:hypothetical protein
MGRRKVLVVSIIAAAVILISGFMGIAVYAQDDDASSGENTHSSFTAKVAAILGLDTATVEAAFAQAKNELRDEAVDKWLANLVEEGRVTQEQADEYKAWLESRPDNLPAVLDSQRVKKNLRGFGGERGCGIMDYRVDRGPGATPPAALDSQ